MKYLLFIFAALAFVGSAPATSTADCCGCGGSGTCCIVDAGCCAK